MNKYYKTKLEEGLRYQDFVADKLGVYCYSSKYNQDKIGENKLGMEIKLDNRYKETGNLYIELYEKSSPKNLQWKESGILRKDNSVLYLIGDYSFSVLFAKKALLEHQKDFEAVEILTSKGFLIPNNKVKEYSIHVYEWSKA